MRTTFSSALHRDKRTSRLPFLCDPPTTRFSAVSVDCATVFSAPCKQPVSLRHPDRHRQTSALPSTLSFAPEPATAPVESNGARRHSERTSAAAQPAAPRLETEPLTGDADDLGPMCESEPGSGRLVSLELEPNRFIFPVRPSQIPPYSVRAREGSVRGAPLQVQPATGPSDPQVPARIRLWPL